MTAHSVGHRWGRWIGTEGAWEWKGHRLEPATTPSPPGLERRRAAEPAVTADMRTIEADLPHARLEGCPDHTLKTPARFKEKLATRIAFNPDASEETHERDIHDGIRYTFSLDEPAYTAGVARCTYQLTKLGYDLERQTNSWDGAGYKGINTLGRTPLRRRQLAGQQVHTRRLRGDREPHDRSLHPSPPPGVATTGGRDHRDPTRSGRHPGSSEGRAMSQPDERHEQDEPLETRYYAVVSPSRTRENPSGLARRRFTPEARSTRACSGTSPGPGHR